MRRSSSFPERPHSRCSHSPRASPPRCRGRLGNLIWLSDGRTEAAAALDFGIRIVHLSCAGKPNLFYSQPEDLSDGLKTEEGWRIYGGHRFWASPESSRSYYPDNAPVACELLADERLRFGPEEICARHLPLGTSLKLGVYTARGEISAENLGQRLTVSCEVHPIDQCADRGCNVELYLNHDVMELETLGMLAALSPGQSTRHTEHWTLEPLQAD